MSLMDIITRVVEGGKGKCVKTLLEHMEQGRVTAEVAAGVRAWVTDRLCSDEGMVGWLGYSGPRNMLRHWKGNGTPSANPKKMKCALVTLDFLTQCAAAVGDRKGAEAVAALRQQVQDTTVPIMDILVGLATMFNTTLKVKELSVPSRYTAWLLHTYNVQGAFSGVKDYIAELNKTIQGDAPAAGAA